MSLDVSTINWLAVLVATAASFMLGGLWYGPLLGKLWQSEVGLSQQELESAKPALIFGPAFALTFIQASFVALFIPPGSGWGTGALLGLIIGGGIVATAFGVNYLFSRNSAKLWGIDALFNVVQLVIMGAIIGAWA